jgi:hypothetical protein
MTLANRYDWKKRKSAPTLIRMALDWLPLVGAGKMSDYCDAPNASITTLTRVFLGDTVSRVFVSERVFVADTTLAGSPRLLAVLAHETISDSDKVGGDRDRGGTAKRGVYQRSSRPESDDAEYHPAMTPGLHARAS